MTTFWYGSICLRVTTKMGYSGASSSDCVQYNRRKNFQWEVELQRNTQSVTLNGNQPVQTLYRSLSAKSLKQVVWSHRRTTEAFLSMKYQSITMVMEHTPLILLPIPTQLIRLQPILTATISVSTIWLQRLLTVGPFGLRLKPTIMVQYSIIEALQASVSWMTLLYIPLKHL